MHPALTEALSRARIDDLRHEAAHHRLARTAAAERAGTRTAISRRLAAVRLAAVGRVDLGRPIEPPGPRRLVEHTGVDLAGACRTLTATGR